jgi:hypothetical protein
MCFGQKSSFGFAFAGLLASWWIYSRTHNAQLATGVFFFFTMELLQGFQYFVIADDLTDKRCDTLVNRVLTLLGFLHICMQPYFCHVINASLTRSERYLWQYRVILRLSALAGLWLFSRFVLAYFGYASTMDVAFPTGADTGLSTEWLRGEKLCTFRGKYHLAWSVPMADPSYYVPSAQIHAFMMYAPFFALWEKRGMIVQGLFLLLTGPVMAAAITPNLMEQASIWCFFSIAQIATMLFLIRETLVLNWGREEHRSSLLAKKPQLQAAHERKQQQQQQQQQQAYPVSSEGGKASGKAA